MASPSSSSSPGHSSDPQQNEGINMEKLEEVLQESQFDWSESQMQQAKDDLNELQGDTKKLISKASETAESMRQLANTLDTVWKNSKTAHAAGTGASIVGGLLTLGGGVATLMTAGAAAPLLVLGMAFGGAGAAVNLTTSYIEASINSKQSERAEKYLKETLEYVNIVNSTIQKFQNGKDIGRLLCIYRLASHTLQMTDPVFKLLQKVISHSSTVVVEYLTKLKAFGTKMMGAKLAGQAAAGLADDAVGAVAKTGAQTADDVVGAGVKAGANGSKVAGNVIVGVSVLFLVWDVIDLSFTIQDLIKESGSEAAKELRKKAYELEERLVRLDGKFH